MDDSILNLIENVGEFTLDSYMADGIMKDLPIVGTFFSMVKIGKSIQDKIFVEKIKSFIMSVEKNEEWKDKFSDIEECQKISKQLLYIVNSCDDDNKLKLIGLAFNYLVKSEITKDEFFYAVNIISKSFYPFLKVLLDIDEADIRFKNDNTKYDYVAITHLLNIGVLDFDGQTPRMIDDKTGKSLSLPSVIVALNGYGEFIKELLIDLN